MKGYAKLAHLMGNGRTNGHYLIFQKFEPLSAQNLLYLQAEILNLQQQLNEILKADAESGDEEKQFYTGDWPTLSNSEDDTQWRKWLEIREKLKEYYDSMARHNMITNLSSPSKNDLQFLQSWLVRPTMGNCQLVGSDRNIYEDQNSAGLITLARKGETDKFSHFVLKWFPKVLHTILINPYYSFSGNWLKSPLVCDDESPSHYQPNSSSPLDPVPLSATGSTCSSSTAHVTNSSSGSEKPTSNSPIHQLDSTSIEHENIDLEAAQVFMYSDSYFYTIANVMSTLVSSLIPMASILILNFVSSMAARLGIICAFTALFSIILSLLTDARRAEIFAGSAAFASVQVVFVGSTQQY